MKTKRVITSRLTPGMVSSEAVYTSSNHLIIQSGTTLTPDIIEKLKYYSIKSIKIDITETQESGDDSLSEVQNPANASRPETQDDTAGLKKQTDTDSQKDISGPTYFDRVEQSEQFAAFKNTFSSSVENFKQQLNDIVIKNNSHIVDDMLVEVNKILSKTRNSLHLLDMLQCLRGFDDLTYMHSMNVALICNVIGGWLNMPKEEVDELIICGLLHDIGKLKIPSEIILKPGKLTDEEFEMIRSHPTLGHEILMTKDLTERVKLAALQHHERFDGSGYPGHLKGDQIGRFSAIVAIADVYDAMTSNRVYRKGICPFKVIGILEQEKNLYDPETLLLFMQRTTEAYINSEVLLSNGERGKVVLLNQQVLSRPVIITQKTTYDLSKNSDIEIEMIV